jgi:hypothetical protein
MVRTKRPRLAARRSDQFIQPCLLKMLRYASVSFGHLGLVLAVAWIAGWACHTGTATVVSAWSSHIRKHPPQSLHGCTDKGFAFTRFSPCSLNAFNRSAQVNRKCDWGSKSLTLPSTVSHQTPNHTQHQ